MDDRPVPPSESAGETSGPAPALADGTRLLEAGNIEGAVRAFQRAAREAPDDWSVQFALGSALLRRAEGDSKGAYRGMAARVLETAATLAPAERAVHDARISATTGVEALEALRLEYRTGRFASQPFARELVRRIDTEIALAPAPRALLATGTGGGSGLPWFMIGIAIVIGVGWLGYRSRGRIASAMSEAAAAGTELARQAEVTDEYVEPLPGARAEPRPFLKEDRPPALAAEMPGHTSAARALVFTDDGERLFSGGYDRTVRGWQMPLGEAVWSSDESRLIVHAVGWDRLNRRVAAVDADGNIDTWGVQENGAIEFLDRFPKVAGHGARMAFSPNGRLSVIADIEGQAVLGDVLQNRPMQRLTAPVPLRAAAFSPDGKLVALGTGKRSVICWELKRGRRWKLEVSHAGASAEVFDLAFAPDMRSLAVAYQDGTIAVLDVPSRQERLNWFVGGESACAIAVSPDGRTLATGGSTGIIRLWDLATSQRRGELAGSKGAVWALAFSPDGESLASAGDDGIIRLWR